MCMCSLRLARDYAQAVNQTRMAAISTRQPKARLTAGSRQRQRERAQAGDRIKRPGGTVSENPGLNWVRRSLRRALLKVYV
jgi:hypothetical protein